MTHKRPYYDKEATEFIYELRQVSNEEANDVMPCQLLVPDKDSRTYLYQKLL